MFVPPIAAFIKLVGMQDRMMWWTYTLITLSALIAPLAASTVYRLTQHVSGSLLAGGFVVIDPVLRWFGVNGWSDSMTMFFTAVAFWGFASTAARPTKLHGIIFGVGLGMLALSHTTWLWPCVLWAVTALPLILGRRRWLPTAVTAPHTTLNPHCTPPPPPLAAPTTGRGGGPANPARPPSGLSPGQRFPVFPHPKGPPPWTPRAGAPAKRCLWLMTVLCARAQTAITRLEYDLFR